MNSLRALIFAVLLSVTFASSAWSQNELVFEPEADPGIGYNLISWINFGADGETVWENAVQNIADAGFTEVSISPVRYYTPGIGSIAQSSSQGPELSHIAAGITRAKQLGLRVTVNPFVEPVGFTGWRGLYNPTPGSSESNTFWSDYNAYVSDVADVAQASGADSMTVGTELRGLVQNSGNNANWSSVISNIDSRFSGRLGYAANWDNYNHPNADNAIWSNSKIDFIGIDAYFQNLVSSSEANNSGAFPDENYINLFRDRWNNLLDNEILPYAASQGGLAVEFLEVGYLPYNGTTRTPQSSGGSLDIDEQNAAFAGLMRALNGRLADGDLLAAHIWQWEMPGSDGSEWNHSLSNPADQPNNTQSAQWLSDFASNPFSLPTPSSAAFFSDFEDGTDQFFTNAFSDPSEPDTDVFSVVDVLGDGNLWLQLPVQNSFQNQGEFNGTDLNRADINEAIYEAVNDITNVVVEYDYLLVTTGATFPAAGMNPFFEVGNYFQTVGPSENFPFTRYQPTAFLGTELSNGSTTFTGSVSFTLDPANSNNGEDLTSPSEILSRFGFTTNSNIAGANLFIDNVRIRSTAITVTLLGDVDLNGEVNFFDIQPFIAILSSSGFQAEADCNMDGVVNFLDISAFIAILSGS